MEQRILQHQQQQQQQSTLPNLLQVKLPANSDRAQKITRATAIFMALDMRPFSVVENEGLKFLLSVLEPPYDLKKCAPNPFQLNQIENRRRIEQC